MPDYLSGVYDWRQPQSPPRDYLSGVYDWRSDFDEEKKKEEERRERIRIEMQEQQLADQMVGPPAPPPEAPRIPADPNQYQTDRAYAGARELLQPPEIHRPPPMEEDPEYLTNREGPVEQLGQGLQMAWSEVQANLQKHAQQAAEAQQQRELQAMAQPNIDVQVQGPHLEDDQFRLKDFAQGQAFLKAFEENRPPPGLTHTGPVEREGQPIGFAGHAIGGSFREGIRSLEALTDLPSRMVEVGRAYQRGKREQYGLEGESDLSRMITGHEKKSAGAQALEALVREGNTNPVSEWFSDFGDAVDEAFPEPETKMEIAGNMAGMMGMIGYEYALGGRAIRDMLGIGKTAEVTKEFATLLRFLKSKPKLAAAASAASNTGRLATQRVGQNVISYGPLDLGQVWTGDASLPHLIDMFGEDKVPGVMNRMNKTSAGKALFELVIGATADAIIEPLGAARVVSKEGRALKLATPEAAALAREHDIPLRGLETTTPKVEAEVPSVVQPSELYQAHPATPGAIERLDEVLADFPWVDRQRALNYMADADKVGRQKVTKKDVEQLYEALVQDIAYGGKTAKSNASYQVQKVSEKVAVEGTPQITEGTVSAALRAREAAEAVKARGINELAARGQQALKRAGARYTELAGGQLATTRSMGSEMQVFFDPELKRDMGLWGGTLIARAKGALSRADFDKQIRARFPAITDNVLSKSFDEATKVYQRYLDKNLMLSDKEWSELLPDGAQRTYTQGEKLSKVSEFGSKAERLVEAGINEGGHKWYRDDLMPWLTDTLGSEEDARVWLALYTATSTGAQAGSSNITLANQAFARWKAGSAIYDPAKGVKLGRRGAMVAPTVNRILEAVRLGEDPAGGFNSPKFANFYAALTGKDRTVIDQWIMRVYGYEYWSDATKVTKDRTTGLLKNEKQSQNLGKAQYEFVAADIDRIAWETRKGGALEHLGKLAGAGDEGMERSAVQAAMWVGAQIEKTGKASDDAMTAVQLLARRIDDITAHTSTDKVIRDNLARTGWAKAGSSHIAALAYMSNTTAGALAGMGVGDTWEERLNNSLAMGVGGALGTRIAGQFVRALKKNGGLLGAIQAAFPKPTQPRKIPVAVEPGIRIPATGDLDKQVTRLRATHTVVADALHDIAASLDMGEVPAVSATTRKASKLRQGGLELGGDFEAGLTITLKSDATEPQIRALMAVASDLLDQRGGMHYRIHEGGSGQTVVMDFRTKPTTAEVDELGRLVKEVARQRGYSDEYLGFSIDGKRMVSVNGTDIPDAEFLDILDEAGQTYQRGKPYRKGLSDIDDARADYDFVEPEGSWEEELVSALQEAGYPRGAAEEKAVRLLGEHRPRARSRAAQAAERGKAPGGVRQFGQDLVDEFGGPSARAGLTGAGVGAVAGGAETGDLEGALTGAAVGATAAIGGTKLLKNTKIGRRLKWDQRGAIGDLTSFKDLPHRTSVELQTKLRTDPAFRQEFMAEIEDANLEDALDNLVGLRSLALGALSNPRTGSGVRKQLKTAVNQANEYIDSLWEKPLTSEELRLLDTKNLDIKPATKLGDKVQTGTAHYDARRKLMKSGDISFKTQDAGEDGFLLRVDGEDRFLSRQQAARVLKELGAIGKRRPSAEAGFATREVLAAIRDVGGGTLIGGAIGGSMDTDSKLTGAAIGAAVGASVGAGSVKGRNLRNLAIQETAKKTGKASRGIIGRALAGELKKGKIRIRQFDTARELRAYTAANPESMVNSGSTAAWLPGKRTVAVLSDKGARDVGYTQSDLISNILSEEDVRITLRKNRKAGKEALQNARAALQLEGGYAEQAKASGIPEATLRYVDRLERTKGERAGFSEQQLRREALASTLAQERIAAGENPAVKLAGSIRTRKSFDRFLGKIQKFNVATQSAEQRLADTFEAHKKAKGLKKTVQHDSSVRKSVNHIVTQMGLDPASKVMELRPGTTKEQMLAIRDMVASNAEDLDKIADYMNSHSLTGDEQDVLMAHSEALTKQMNDLLDRFSKTRTEYGRNLRALSLVAQRSFDPQNRQTWYLMAKQRHPRGVLTEEIRSNIDVLIAAGDRAGLVDYIARLQPAPRHRKLLRLWKAGLLTSPKTHLRNNLGNAAMATLEEFKDVPAMVADRALVMLAGRMGYKADVTKGAKNMRQVVRAGRQGALEGWNEFFTVMKGADGEQAVREVAAKLDLVGDVRFDNTLLDAYTSLAFRSLSAEDKLWRSIARYRSLLDQSAAMAKNEARGGKKNRAWMKERTKELLNNPTDEMLIRAKTDELFAVFQNENRLAKWINKGKKVKGLGPVLEYAMPFVNTPMNIFARIVDYSPAGMVTASKQAVQLLRKAEIDGAFDPKLQRELVDRFGRAGVGTLAMSVGLAFYLNDKMRVSYPDKPKEREKWKLTGEMDGSILVAGKWRQIRNVSPIGNLMLIGGAMGQLMDDPDVTNWPSLIEGVGGATLEQFREMPMLTGINTISKAVDNWDYEAGRLSRNMARSFVPSIIRDFSRALDNTVRQTKSGPAAAAQGSTPIASRTLPPQVDVLGRELKRDQGPVGSFVDLFSSRKDKRNSKDPVIRALLDLEVDIGPRQRISGESDWQHFRRTKAQGEDLYRRIRAEVQSAGFQNLSREEQGDHLRGRIGVWRRRMTEAWDDQHPDYP